MPEALPFPFHTRRIPFISAVTLIQQFIIVRPLKLHKTITIWAPPIQIFHIIVIPHHGTMASLPAWQSRTGPGVTRKGQRDIIFPELNVDPFEIKTLRTADMVRKMAYHVEMPDILVVGVVAAGLDIHIVCAAADGTVSVFTTHK